MKRDPKEDRACLATIARSAMIARGVGTGFPGGGAEGTLGNPRRGIGNLGRPGFARPGVGIH